MEPGKLLIGISPDMPTAKRAPFHDLIMGQVKVRIIQEAAWIGFALIICVQTMSFLAYMLRVSSSSLAAYVELLPRIAMRLYQDCPSDSVAIKKVRRPLPIALSEF